MIPDLVDKGQSLMIFWAITEEEEIDLNYERNTRRLDQPVSSTHIYLDPCSLSLPEIQVFNTDLESEIINRLNKFVQKRLTFQLHS